MGSNFLYIGVSNRLSLAHATVLQVGGESSPGHAASINPETRVARFLRGDWARSIAPEAIFGIHYQRLRKLHNETTQAGFLVLASNCATPRSLPKPRREL